MPEDNWHTKLLALRLLGQFAERSQIPFSRTLYQVIQRHTNYYYYYHYHNIIMI